MAGTGSAEAELGSGVGGTQSSSSDSGWPWHGGSGGDSLKKSSQELCGVAEAGLWVWGAGLWEVAGGAGAWAQRFRPPPARGGDGTGAGAGAGAEGGGQEAWGRLAFELEFSIHVFVFCEKISQIPNTAKHPDTRTVWY